MSGGFNRKWKLGRQMNSSFMKCYTSIAVGGKNTSHLRGVRLSISSRGKRQVCKGVFNLLAKANVINHPLKCMKWIPKAKNHVRFLCQKLRFLWVSTVISGL